MKKLLLMAVLCTAFTIHGMNRLYEESDSNSEIEKPAIEKPVSPIMSRLEFLAALREVAAFDCEEHISAQAQKETSEEIDVLDNFFSTPLNLSDFTPGQKITLFNTILAAHVQNRNVEKTTELLEALKSDPRHNPEEIIDEEIIEEAANLRKRTKDLISIYGNENYARSRVIHKMLDNYSDTNYHSFSSDSENESSGYNSDEDSPGEHPFDMPNRRWRHCEVEATPSPKLTNTITEEMTQLLESQMDDIMVLGSLFD